MRFLASPRFLKAGLRLLFHQATRRCFVGVRTIAVRNGEEVLLIRHTYRPGWHLPGGGVDPGEAPATAAIRELWEETGLVVRGAPSLVSAHIGRYLGLDNYVMVYAVTEFDEGPFDSPEIAETGWFTLQALPGKTTESTRRRLGEFFQGTAKDDRW